MDKLAKLADEVAKRKLAEAASQAEKVAADAEAGEAASKTGRTERRLWRRQSKRGNGRSAGSNTSRSTAGGPARVGGTRNSYRLAIGASAPAVGLTAGVVELP